MKHEKIWHTCDICGDECIPVKQIKIYVDRDRPKNEILLFKLAAQFSNTYKDLCKMCTIKLLKKWIEEQEADNDTE